MERGPITVEQENKYKKPLGDFFALDFHFITDDKKLPFWDKFWLKYCKKHLKTALLSDEESEATYKEIHEILKNNELENKLPLLNG